MRRSLKKKIVPSYVFKKIDGIKHTPRCLGCGQKFVTYHSAKKYCDRCLNRGKKTVKKKPVKRAKKAKKVKKKAVRKTLVWRKVVRKVKRRVKRAKKRSVSKK